MECFSCVDGALEELRLQGSDAATVTGANGLLKRLKEFDVVLCLFVLQAIFLQTGPVSRVLQSVDADLSVSMSLLRGCVGDLSEMRNDADSQWKSIVECASKFATEHDIEPQLLSNQRKRKKKRLDGELASDERDAPNLETFKVEVFVKALDSVLMQLKDRFSDNNVDIIREMS